MAGSAVETMKVQPWSPDHGPFVVINKADFDPAVHKPYEGDAPKAAKLAKPAPAQAGG